jgi:hypothetical protein
MPIVTVDAGRGDDSVCCYVEPLNHELFGVLEGVGERTEARLGACVYCTANCDLCTATSINAQSASELVRSHDVAN